MAIMTPPLHARGVFKLKTPWNAPADHVFEVIAIRSFRDFIERGDDVFKRFYLPKDETEDKEAHNTAHQRDNRQGLCLLRLSLLLRGLNGHTVRSLLIELGCLLAKLGVLVELGLGVVGVFRHDFSFR